MLKIGKFEYCNHRPVCVCEGLGGYVKMTDIIEKQVGQVEHYHPKEITDEVTGYTVPGDGWRWYGRSQKSIHEPVFKYSWLWPRRVGR